MSSDTFQPAGAGLVAPEFDAMARMAAGLGAAPVAADARQVVDRLQAGRLHVACVGQFKRGKSTLLNALVGEAILPAGVPPVTSTVTVLRYGAERGATVHFADGTARPIRASDIGAYVSEGQNPENAKGVDLVDVCLPSRLLETGLCLIDTPGVGSVLAGNTAVTRAFIPHIDAALVVMGGDPPISGEELSLVVEIAAQVDRLIFVLNKADRLSEADRGEAARFTTRVLAERLGRAPDPLIEVSATGRLAGETAFEWPALERALAVLVEEAAGVLEQVRARASRRLVRRLLAEVDEHEAALRRPIDESARRLDAIRRWIDEADRAVRDLGQLLAVRQQELARTFEAARASFVAGAAGAGRDRVAAALARLTGRAGRRRADGMREAGVVARALVGDWLDRIEPDAARVYREAIGRFVQLANDLSSRLARTGAAGSPELSSPFEPDEGFSVRRGFYFTGIMQLTSPGPLGWLLDVTLPGRWRQPAVRRDVLRYFARLLDSNSRRVAADLDERVLESRRRLEAELRARLSEQLAVAERALVRAREQRAGGEEAVRAELRRLETLRQELAAIAAAAGAGAV
ncbi:MAG TPA: dynamin family protein [Vicinamibacterales bacterium]|nr:dynamin family protein [Vicinamibacterales bacterium]